MTSCRLTPKGYLVCAIQEAAAVSFQRASEIVEEIWPGLDRILAERQTEACQRAIDESRR